MPVKPECAAVAHWRARLLTSNRADIGSAGNNPCKIERFANPAPASLAFGPSWTALT